MYLKCYLLYRNAETIILHHRDMRDSLAQQQNVKLLATDHRNRGHNATEHKKVMLGTCKEIQRETAHIDRA